MMARSWDRVAQQAARPLQFTQNEKRKRYGLLLGSVAFVLRCARPSVRMIVGAAPDETAVCWFHVRSGAIQCVE